MRIYFEIIYLVRSQTSRDDHAATPWRRSRRRDVDRGRDDHLVVGWIFDLSSDPFNFNSQGMLLDLSHQQDFELLLFSHLEGISTSDALTSRMHGKSQGESIF